LIQLRGVLVGSWGAGELGLGLGLRLGGGFKGLMIYSYELVGRGFFHCCTSFSQFGVGPTPSGALTCALEGMGSNHCR
jgi:hypothetical protein